MNYIHEEDPALQIDNLPNRLTIFRILLIPIVIAFLYLSAETNDYLIPYKALLGWIAGWIFVAASITDFFDGYIARKKRIVTVFGSFLDPIADKFLIVSSLIMLQALGRVPAIIVIVLVLREMYMTSLRLLATNEGIPGVPVSWLGKWKTGFQMVAIPMLMANENLAFINLPFIGTVFIYIAFITSILSALIYSQNTIKKLKDHRASKKKNRKLAKENKNDT